jgi:hypothetical protein
VTALPLCDSWLAHSAVAPGVVHPQPGAGVLQPPTVPDFVPPLASTGGALEHAANAIKLAAATAVAAATVRAPIRATFIKCRTVRVRVEAPSKRLSTVPLVRMRYSNLSDW